MAPAPSKSLLHTLGFADDRWFVLSRWCQNEKPNKAMPDQVCKLLWPLKCVKPVKTSEPRDIIIPTLATFFLSLTAKAGISGFDDRDTSLLTAAPFPSWSAVSFMDTPLNTNLVFYYDNSSFLGHYQALWILLRAWVSGFGCQVSGRPSRFHSWHPTPEALAPMSNFHAIQRQLGCHSHFSKLIDDI